MLGLPSTSTRLSPLGSAVPNRRSAPPSPRLGVLFAPLPGCIPRTVRRVEQDRAAFRPHADQGDAHD